MSDLEISLARPGDYDAVDALVDAAYEHDYGPRRRPADALHASLVRADLFDVWVARDTKTGELLGSVTTPKEGGERLMEDSTPDELDFRLLAVSPNARRRGVGAALTSHVVDLARQRGRRAVFMKSAPNMIGAHRLYEKLEFRREPERDGLILGGVKQFDLYAFRIDVDPVPTGGVPAERTSTNDQ